MRPRTGDNRPENSAQASEKMDSAPGNGRPADSAPSPDTPNDAPDFHIPAAWRGPNVRLTLNGGMAW